MDPPRESPKAKYSNLNRIFRRSSESSTSSPITPEVIELNLDDTKCYEPPSVSLVSQEGGNDNRDKKTEREKLFEGGTSETKAKQRSVEEIKAKYRKSTAQDATAAALQARDKLRERQQKLEVC